MYIVTLKEVVPWEGKILVLKGEGNLLLSGFTD